MKTAILIYLFVATWALISAIAGALLSRKAPRKTWKDYERAGERTKFPLMILPPDENIQHNN